MVKKIIIDNIAILRNEGINEGDALSLIRGCLVLRTYSLRYEKDIDEHKTIWERLIRSEINRKLILESAEEIEKNIKELEGVVKWYCFRGINEVNEKSLREIFDSINEITKVDAEMNIKEISQIIDERCKINERYPISTSVSLNRVLFKLMDSNKEKDILDFCAGRGDLMINIMELMEAFNDKKMKNRITTCEFNKQMVYDMKLKLFFNDYDNFKVIQSDIFAKLPENNDGKVLKYDSIICCPLFSYRERLFDITKDRYNRYSYGVPSKGNVEWATIQTAMYCLKRNGKAALILPKGAFFRTSEKDMRKSVIESDVIEAIISIPAGLIDGTGIPVDILIINMDKNKSREKKILFVDASKEFEVKNRREVYLSETQQNKIVETVLKGDEIKEYSRFVDLRTIEENEFTLNSKVYITYEELKEKLDNSVELGLVAEIVRGVTVSKNDLEELKDPQGYYFLNVKDIVDDKIKYETCTRIRCKKDIWENKYIMKENDIVVTCKGFTFKSALIKEDFRESIISSNLMIIRVDKEKYDPVVLYKYLNSDFGRRVMESVFSGTVQKIISPSNLKLLSIPNYTRETLSELSELISKNEIAYKEAIEKAKKMYDEKNNNIRQIMGI